MAPKIKITKQSITHWTLVIIGCVLLGFSTSIFLTKNSIVSGGLSGIGIIVQHLIDPSQETMVVDITVWIASAGLWLLSLFTLGKQFAFKTLLATLLYPISLTMFLRIPAFVDIADAIAGAGTTGDLLICSLFGGLINGMAISLTFLGKGSTGGVDVISFLINKIFGFPVSAVTLIIDVIIIVSGMFFLNFPTMIVNSLCGIICAAMMAIMIQSIYSKRENAVLVDIISPYHKEICDFILNKVNRGVTTYDATGGYTGEKRVMIRSVVSNEEYQLLKDYIGKIDQNAFITFTPTYAVYGEGFKENIANNQKAKNFMNKGKNHAKDK